MVSSYLELQNSHPCLGKHAPNTGRIHLPVSPGCNIACRFCDRVINDVEERPGVTSNVITPDESLEVLERALDLCPQITVAGIAGPGDTLASNYALDTFRLVGQRFPHLIKCMSTNGLLLNERAEEIIDVGIDSLTVTVNAIDPEIEAKLNKRIYYHGRRYEGVEAAEILIENQLGGIWKVAEAGITVKVNTVLVPRINGAHIEEIARTVAAAGARIYNVIPLIPQFDLASEPPPTCEEIETAIRTASRYIDVFRHCKRCRADSVGIPGISEFRTQVFKKALAVKETFSHG